ncbi:hypothetical protein [Sphingomonas sp. 3-13AW]|uniref:hypothetical protein n=1 Tax=Sphingomonas sp. 3-13AW TaxID=3050450 RepID=UPI003BB4A8FE
MDFALGFALAAAAVLLPGGQAGTSKVEVDGKTYRVTVEGESVVVARKSMLVRYDIEERDRQRLAVEKATGCRIADELPSSDARLRGRLVCSPASETPGS